MKHISIRELNYRYYFYEYEKLEETIDKIRFSFGDNEELVKELEQKLKEMQYNYLQFEMTVDDIYQDYVTRYKNAGIL